MREQEACVDEVVRGAGKGRGDVGDYETRRRHRGPRVARNAVEASIPVTAAFGNRWTSRAVVAPGPQPRSATRAGVDREFGEERVGRRREHGVEHAEPLGREVGVAERVAVTVPICSIHRTPGRRITQGVDERGDGSGVGQSMRWLGAGAVGAEELVAAPAVLLGPVHRGVGVADERVGVVVGPGRRGDPDARADLGRLPADRDGDATASRIRCATSWSSPRSATCCMSTTNSSPPKRATMSWARTALRSRAAAVRRSASPASWPRTSFTSLKRSRSMNISATVPVR